MRLLRRPTMRTVSLALAGILALAALSGCGGKAKREGPEMVAVCGIVTHAGQPVANAVVTFQPTEGMRYAVGRTDATGHYSLSTSQPDDGALPAEYLVQIVKYEEPSAAVEEGATPPLKNLLPRKYADPKTSGLKATVTNTGTNTFDFDLP